ncbi:MAG: tyrosine-type recombinase/integrase [Ruminiclostridium sp.]|nr:tyrosine-type recombinase/integrase [Ruminiclostridium sp.]
MLRQFKAEQDRDREQTGDKWIDTDRLFVKWNGLPMHNNTPYFWFSEFCEKHGFRFCDIHSLRHLHCSLLINAGIDVVAVSGDLGHSCVGTTLNLYSHKRL